jgi:hypothetical protein
MDRVMDDVLTLAAIAKFWSRAPESVHTEDEIFCLLVQAVWRGDLTVEVPAGRVPHNGDYRYNLLRAVDCVRDHPGILFVLPGEAVEPIEEMLDDGTTLLDLREQIAWVADGEEPDDATAKAAFAALASVDLDAYDEATILPILKALPIERDGLQEFCEVAGYALPTFWFAKGASQTKASAVARCRTWFETLMKAGEYPGPKPEVRMIAMRKFKGLSARAFDKVWNEKAPEWWKRPGRRIGSLRRNRAAP